MAVYPEKEKYTADDLAAIVKILRDPVNGCPWDSVQTHRSIRKNFLEEAYEAIEAIDTQDAELLQEELGDVLMQIMLHSEMEAEQGNFDFIDVCDAVSRKLISRHPHIFGTPEQQQAGIMDWDTIKNKEKGRRSLKDEVCTVPNTLPALMYAQKLQKRVQPYGYVTADAEEAAAMWQAEGAAFAAAAATDADKQQLMQAAGKLLFSTVNLLRNSGVDAEEVLMLYNRVFARNCIEKEDSNQV